MMTHTVIDTYEITEEEGNYELIINGLEVWVGTYGECQAKLEQLKAFISND